MRGRRCSCFCVSKSSRMSEVSRMQAPCASAGGVLLGIEPPVEQGAVIARDLQVMCIQERISCQTCREKGQASRRCCIVSGSWSHKGHAVWCWSPCRARRSAVQQRSRLTILFFKLRVLQIDGWLAGLYARFYFNCMYSFLWQEGMYSGQIMLD